MDHVFDGSLQHISSEYEAASSYLSSPIKTVPIFVRCYLLIIVPFLEGFNIKKQYKKSSYG